jgi:hypothetical protein
MQQDCRKPLLISATSTVEQQGKQGKLLSVLNSCGSRNFNVALATAKIAAPRSALCSCQIRCCSLLPIVLSATLTVALPALPPAVPPLIHTSWESCEPPERGMQHATRTTAIQKQ